MCAQKISMSKIDYFLAVARHLNFTEAAKSLYISQPSISKQIALLEKEIGVQLFHRTKRNVTLTPAGKELYKELSAISRQIENAIDRCKDLNLGENSSIAIGFLEAMNTKNFLKEIIGSYKEKFPKVKIVLERYSFKNLREKLIDGSLDLIFTFSFEVDDSTGVHSQSVFQTNSSIVMPVFHPLAERDSLKLSELCNEDFVLISRDESPRAFDAVINLCKKSGFTPNIIKQLPNVESLLLCVESGLGITIFDSTIRMFDTDSFRLFPINDDSIEIIIAWKNENINPAVGLFINNIKNY